MTTSLPFDVMISPPWLGFRNLLCRPERLSL